MYKQILHTPEGVRDIYNGECRRKQFIQDQLHQVLLSYGYEDIQTPTFEFFDVFSREIGTVPSRELYKFFDREGNTLLQEQSQNISQKRTCRSGCATWQIPLSTVRNCRED